MNRQLGLFQGDESAETLTLRGCFEFFVVPAKVCRPGTLAADRTAIRWLGKLVPSTETGPAAAITSRELAIFRAGWLPRTHLSPQTFNKHLRHLKSIFAELVDQELLPKAPRCKPLQEEDPDVRVASGDEIARLFLACDAATWPRERGIKPADYWRALIVVGYTTGLRKSDILSIKPPDINLSGRFLTYRAKKTGKGRSLPLHEATCGWLEKLAAKCPSRVHRLFYSTKSNHQFYREWAGINARAGICPPIQVHDLRRTCGSLVFESAGLNAASEMLAHSSVAVTRRHYISGHAAAESLRGAVNAISVPLGLAVAQTDVI